MGKLHPPVRPPRSISQGRSLILCLVFALAADDGAVAQERFFRVFDEQAGLSSSEVYALAQDRLGFIWIGTQGGLASDRALSTAADPIPSPPGGPACTSPSDMRSLIDKLEEGGALKHGYATELRSHLGNAEKFAQKGDAEKAIEFYHHMIGHIERWFEEEIIIEGVRDDLIGCTDDLLGRFSLVQISAGSDHTCALNRIGQAYCWGSDANGQLGDGEIEHDFFSTTPVAVAGGHTYTTISAGRDHTCALTLAGDAYCWGDIIFAGIGHSAPAPVIGGVPFSTISAGVGRACALTYAGDAYCWGSGILGDGDLVEGRLEPVAVAVAGGHTYTAISAGNFFTCGLTTSGNAYCWGYNTLGQLGDGTTTDRLTPVLVAGKIIFSGGVSAGSGYACGPARDGNSYCWGRNSSGALGDGTTINSLVPVPVAGGHTFHFISAHASGIHTCALTSGGIAYCWGENDRGELGDGTNSDRHVPVSVTGGLTFSVISSGGNHTCGLASGSAYCWGSNFGGELGDGTPGGSSNVPVRVAFP